MSAVTSTGQSSRESDAGAGWECAAGTFTSLLETRPTRIDWFNARILWESRNDVLARVFGDPTDDDRIRWVGGLTDDDLTVELGLDDFSFLLLGDTGEGDYSQYALVPAVAARGQGTAFLFICSDVIYPLGDVNDYVDKFYRPYGGYPGPIYAIPGNHDWYDGLQAFMRHFCGREPFEPPPARFPSKAHLRTRLWRKPTPFDQTRWDAGSSLRAQPTQKQAVPQKGPYFTIDTERLRLVCIDTGIKKDLDQVQGEWLVRVSKDPRKKILLTGSPIYVDGGHQPTVIMGGGASGYETVDAVVRDPAHNYVAAIGGDIHNYQRYPVRVGDRTIQYIVSGGGGAFMHATHLIAPIDPEACGGVTEDEFKCYPLRRDSLAVFSRLLDRKLHTGGRLQLTPDEAVHALLRKYPALSPTRPVGTKLGRGRRRWIARSAAMLMPAHRGFHKWLSPFFDWDDPPFFKNFLRFDVDERGLTIRVYGVTGCATTESDPALEEEIGPIEL